MFHCTLVISKSMFFIVVDGWILPIVASFHVRHYIRSDKVDFFLYINLKNSRFARTKKCVKGYKKVEKVAEYISLKCLDKRHAKSYNKSEKVAE